MSSECEARHDPDLSGILAAEDNSIPAFFNAVFGFLARHCPEEIYGSTQISGEHLVSQSYCKWRQQYLANRAQEPVEASHCEDGVVPVPPVAKEVVVATDNEQEQKTPVVVEHDGANITPHGSNRPVCPGRLDTNNGADCGNYSWTQTIEDLEVRIPVPSTIRKGRQVQVSLQSGSVGVSVEETSTRGLWRNMMEGKFPHEVRGDESMWSLVPGEHVSIHLEKSEERWWDRLLVSEEPIDLKQIDAERDFSTLPEEERQRIRELMWNRQQKEQGKSTSDQKRLEGVLREAWNAEGSPFKGQMYDPSVLDMAASGGILGHT
ncbi:hypothetical protein Pmani_015164 [Petrolisthes manimaculis]|uniref:CS domain-containing protein n=1 Tax=Petrolisthes manimaculis TaxID=1843537 RepID=A0AAE1P3C7_9EUCA|nr:hypothetical protein Pmani_026475 [Petrolisthes manimaculis]KAK4313502.1 hypothetical protein Pmani_015164 [Petrolisthes manimaculis]